MYSLMLDSSYKDLVVGLGKDGKLISETLYECFQKQSEYMIPEIKKILDVNHVNPKEIREVCVTVGPGSYTGVRIALTIAKVYCYSLKINCYAYSSLKVLEKHDVNSICLINARSNRSYIGVYKNNEVILKDQIMKNDEVKEYIKNHSDFIVCGDTEYLDIEGYKASISSNMLSLKNEEDLVENIMTLKAVYMKD